MTTMERARTARALANQIQETNDPHVVRRLSAQLEKIAEDSVREAREAIAAESRTVRTPD